MSDFKFQDTHFAVDEKAIHLLRNGFNYKSIEFKSIEKIEIKRGNVLKNRLFLIIFGLTSLTFSLFYFYRIYQFWVSPVGGRVYIEEFLMPIFLLFLGAYCVYASLKKEIMIEVINNKKHKFSLETINKEGQLRDFVQFLKQKSPVNVIHNL